MTNQRGGIIDDLMLTRTPDHLLLVVNAACKETDYAYPAGSIGPGLPPGNVVRPALLALQGPEAAGVLGRFTNHASPCRF